MLLSPSSQIYGPLDFLSAWHLVSGTGPLGQAPGVFLRRHGLAIRVPNVNQTYCLDLCILTFPELVYMRPAAASTSLCVRLAGPSLLSSRM